MNNKLQQEIAQSTAHRPVRDRIAAKVLQNRSLFHDLLAMALDITWEHYHKACWTLELVLEKEIIWLKPHLDIFCRTLAHLKTDGAKRSASKICLFAVEKQFKDKSFLTETQLQYIVEACFDWVIDPDEKVATKAYSIRALFRAGKLQPWIYPELKPILEKDYKSHSAAYQVVAREVLKGK